MATATSRARSLFAVDWYAATFATLFLLVQAAAVALAPPLSKSVDQMAFGMSTTSPTAGAAWVVAEILWLLVVVGLALLWNRLPEWVQEMVSKTLAFAIILYAGAVFARGDSFVLGAALFLGSYVLITAIDEIGLWWVLNNILGLFLAALFGAVGGALFGIGALIVAIIGLTVYDHIFADRSWMMFEAAEWFMRARLPVVIIIPTRWRVDWDDDIMAAFDDDEEDGEDGEESEADGIAMGIGMADFALPAMFAASVAVYSGAPPLALGIGAPALGIIVGAVVAVFRLRREMLTSGSGAGMPALAAGAFGGYLLGLGIAAVQVALMSPLEAIAV